MIRQRRQKDNCRVICGGGGDDVAQLHSEDGGEVLRPSSETDNHTGEQFRLAMAFLAYSFV